MSKKVKKPRFKKEKISYCHPDGSEKLCSKPTELRKKINAPVSLREKMRSLWAEFRDNEIHNNQYESIEDAQDFNVSNDDFPRSQYEIEGELNDQLDYDEQFEQPPVEVEKQQGEDSVEVIKEDSGQS